MRCASARVYKKFPPRTQKTPTLQQFQRPIRRISADNNNQGNQTEFEPQIMVKKIQGIQVENHSISKIIIQRSKSQIPRQITQKFSGKLIQGIWCVNSCLNTQKQQQLLEQDLNISVVKQSTFTPVNLYNIQNYVDFASQIVQSAGVTILNESQPDIKRFRTGRFKNIQISNNLIESENVQKCNCKDTTSGKENNIKDIISSDFIIQQKLIHSTANQASSLILFKYISTNNQSLKEGTLQISQLYYQWLDIVYYKDFGLIKFSPLHNKLLSTNDHLNAIVEIFECLDQKMLLGCIQKKLIYINNLKFDIFEYAFQIPVQQLYTRLQFSDLIISSFSDFSFQKIFQLLYLISIQKSFFPIQELQHRSYLFFTVAVQTSISFETFSQAEHFSTQFFQFSKQLLNFSISYTSNVLALIYQNYNLKNKDKLSVQGFKIFDESIQGLIQNEQDKQIQSSFYDIIFENLYGYNFKKTYYVKANEFLTYSTIIMDEYIFEGVYIYYFNHFDKFFKPELAEISKFTAYQIIPKVQILLFLSVQYIKSLCLSQSTCNVVASAFQGVIPCNIKLFIYCYQTITYLFKMIIDDKYIQLLLQSTKSAQQQFVLAKHSQFCNQILSEILMINYMIVGNDLNIELLYKGDVSKMIFSATNSYDRNTYIEDTLLFKISKNFIYQEIERLYIACNDCELLHQKLLSILIESDVVSEKLFDISKNVKFLEIIQNCQKLNQSELLK
eukprot:EST47214.1 Hypothetical protein SS50377_12725 [Spironucleus salmonicida]